MNLNLISRTKTVPLHLTVLWVLGVLVPLTLSAFLPLTAYATCTLATSMADVDFGKAVVRSLPASELPHYRRMGTRQFNINGNCEASQTTIQLAFEGLVPMDTKPLVQWGTTGGAAILRIDRASVGGAAVPVSLAGSGLAASTTALSLAGNGTLELDLTGLPATARKTFSVQLAVSTLVPEAYVPRSLPRIYSQYSVRMVGAN